MRGCDIFGQINKKKKLPILTNKRETERIYLKKMSNNNNNNKFALSNQKKNIKFEFIAKKNASFVVY